MKLQNYLASSMLLAFLTLPIVANATGATATYSVTVSSPAAASLSATTSSDSVQFSNSGVQSVTDSSITITNSGTSSGTVYAQLGSAPSGITYGTSTSPSTAGQITVQSSCVPVGATVMSTLNSSSTTELQYESNFNNYYSLLSGGSTCNVSTEFYVAPGTTSGNYAIPVTFTLQ